MVGAAPVVPEHGRVRSPAPRPRRGRPERRAVQRAAPRAVLVPRRAARRAAEDVGEIDVRPPRRRARARHGALAAAERGPSCLWREEAEWARQLRVAGSGRWGFRMAGVSATAARICLSVAASRRRRLAKRPPEAQRLTARRRGRAIFFAAPARDVGKPIVSFFFLTTSWNFIASQPGLNH
jgi:hypothetical protein